MNIMNMLLVVATHFAENLKNLRNQAIKFGNEVLHWLGLSIDYEQFDAMIPLGMYLLLTENHKILLRSVAVLNEPRRREFAHMFLLDDISLSLICLPAILIKFYPVISEGLKVVVSSIIYTALAMSIFIQRRIKTKLALI